MNVLALCAGIAGIERGVSAVVPAARTVAYVERGAYQAAVLVSRMAGGQLCPAPVWDDLATFDGKPWRGKVDLVTAGYPCQGESSAGLRRGADDPRWLWDHVWRVVGEVGSRYVFVENVAAHLGRSFGRVLGALAESGWSAEWACIRASELGAPHRRDRLFCLGSSPAADPSGIRLETRGGLRPGWAEFADGSWRDAFLGPDRVDNGLPHRLDRVHALGNAVVPVQAAVAFAELWRRLNQTQQNRNNRNEDYDTEDNGNSSCRFSKLRDGGRGQR